MDIDRMSKVSLGTGNKIIRCIYTKALFDDTEKLTLTIMFDWLFN